VRGGPLDFSGHRSGEFFLCLVRIIIDPSGEEEDELELIVEFKGFATVLGNQRFSDGWNPGTGTFGEIFDHENAGIRCGMEFGPRSNEVR
jgi:hypothetical protein